MAQITNLLIARHLRADASTHVLHYRGATLARSGRGLAFWFLPMSVSIAEVPVDDRELSILFHARSSDFQDVTAQCVVTYRIVDPATLARRVDFTIDLSSGAYLRQPLEKIALLLTELSHQHAASYIGETPIRSVLAEGYARIRERVLAGLSGDAGVREMGVAIASVRVSSVKPAPDLEKALEAPMREKIQQESDEAAFSRRAMAVEKERAIQENALVNQIELARREEQLIAQRGQNARRQAGEHAEAQRIASEAEATRSRLEADSAAHRTRVSGEATAGSVRLVDGARVEVERARMEVLRDVPAQVLLGLAARELATKLRRIDHLNLSPDALGPMVQALVDAGTRRLEAPAGTMSPGAPAPRVVVVTRATDYEALLARHGTREAARFFLETRGQFIDDAAARNARFAEALDDVMRAIPTAWRRNRVDRDDLSRFVFEPSDLIVAVGQDGLVANAAKYLDGQRVIGVNPDPARIDGVLVHHRASRAGALLRATAEGRVPLEERTMVEAVLEDGQRLLALNEVFLGHRTHQSARYRLRHGEREERQSSSGIVVSTGTGATGWARSIQLQRRTELALPAAADARLSFHVREAFPSVATGTSLVDGLLATDEALEVTSEMNDGGTLFGDGIEADRIELGWGLRVRVRVARERLRLVR